MDKLKLRLMHQEARRLLEDAETLTEALGLGRSGESAYLLRLLGLELLLKIVFESVLGKPGQGHEYERLFGALPQDVQARLLSLAGERVGPSALAVSHELVLKEWGKNFVALRYPWERYARLSEEQYVALGEDWVSRGAPTEEATFRYHPTELVGMLEALRIVVSELDNRSANGTP